MWYCLADHQEYGPFSLEEASRFVQEHPDCLVWRDGMPEWVPAKKFALLTNQSATAPMSDIYFDSGLDFKICGDDMQYVEVTLQPGESIIAEPGSMIYKEIAVEMEALLGTGRKQGFVGKLFGAGKRVLSGESAFLSSFINTLDHPAKVALSAPYPGKIIPVSLSGFGGEIICQKDSFLCAQSDIDIGIYFQKKIMTALFGGAGFIMQRLNGDGVVFIHAGGTISEIDLKEDEFLQVDIGCLVAFQPSVHFEVTGTGSIKAQLFGGSGLFFANMRGPGKVWIQSLPFSRLAQRFAEQIHPQKK